MSYDRILGTFNDTQVNYLLIGGVNFLMRHAAYITYDIDLWIEDTFENRARTEAALVILNAQWGPSDETWLSVSKLPPGWLERQSMFCLTSAFGPIDIFREVRGLAAWSISKANALEERTFNGVPYWGISDEDMLQCQLALEEGKRNVQRIQILQTALRRPRL